MRTTLTLEPDVARLIEDQAHRLRQSFKQVVNEALRRGLSPERSPAPRYRVQPHVAKLRPGMDPARFNSLVDDVEVDETFQRRSRRRKSP